MHTFHAAGFRPVRAETAKDAAMIFADHIARKEYGRRGYCRTLRLDCWTDDHKSYTFEAFIGRDVPGRQPRACSGHNVWVCLDVA